ncbi:MAG: T9SS type A sorting domain-containing protein [Flavobacteriales bacterium]
MYPNPVHDVINLSSDNAALHNICVMNEFGQVVLSYSNLNDVAITFGLDYLSAGVYLIRIELIDGTMEVQRFIKQ